MTEDRTYNQRPQSLTLRIILGLTISVIVYLLIAGTTFNPTLLAVVILGAVTGFNLMFPAVAYDGSDSFDSISRSFSYVYAKPWRMLFYSSIAAIYGSISYTFIRVIAFLALSVTRTFLQFVTWTNNSTDEVNKIEAIWPKPDFINLFGNSTITAVTWPEKIAHFLIYICVLVVVGLVVSFIISFYFSANTIIYSLLRKKVDSTEINDIYTYYNETDSEPTIPEVPQKKETPKTESDSDSDS